MYLTKFVESNISDIACDDLDSNSSIRSQIYDYLSNNIFFSVISLIAITIFVMPGSWPAFTFLFFRSFMRQDEQLNTSGDTIENEGIN
jgi:hypothetical protein